MIKSEISCERKPKEITQDDSKLKPCKYLTIKHNCAMTCVMDNERMPCTGEKDCGNYNPVDPKDTYAMIVGE